MTAKRATIGWPVEMPPRMPPALLDRKTRLAVVAHAHLVGVLLARERGGGEAGADLDAFDRIDAHQRRGEVAVELAIDRRAETRPARLRRSPRSRRRPRSRACGRRRDSLAEPAPSRRRGRRTDCARPRPSPSGAIDLVRADLDQRARARSCPARSCARWRRPRPASRSRARRRGRRRDNRAGRIWRRRCSRRGRAGTCP